MCPRPPEGLLETRHRVPTSSPSRCSPSSSSSAASPMTSILGDYISIMNCWSYLLSTKALTVAVANDPPLSPTTSLTTNVFQSSQPRQPLLHFLSPRRRALLEPQPSVQAPSMLPTSTCTPRACAGPDHTVLRQANKASCQACDSQPQGFSRRRRVARRSVSRTLLTCNAGADAVQRAPRLQRRPSVQPLPCSHEPLASPSWSQQRQVFSVSADHQVHSPPATQSCADQSRANCRPCRLIWTTPFNMSASQ
jgi:hypothetical protein